MTLTRNFDELGAEAKVSTPSSPAISTPARRSLRLHQGDSRLREAGRAGPKLLNATSKTLK